MSLDEIIKIDKIQGVRKRGRGGNAGGAGVRRGFVGKRRSDQGNWPSRNAGRSDRQAPYSRSANMQAKWQHDKFESGGRVNSANLPNRRGNQSGAGGAQLLVTNLDFGVSNSDLVELFSEYGQLKKAAVHYDKSGRSLGTADVVYQQRADAVLALNKYNGIPLDGRPMKIQLVSAPTQASEGSFSSSWDVQMKAAQRLNNVGPQRNNRGGIRGRVGGGNFSGNRGSGRGGRGGGRPSKPKTPTAEELDAELDAYTSRMEV